MEEILGPTDLESFFQTHWEKNFLHIKGEDPNRFRELFKPSDILTAAEKMKDLKPKNVIMMTNGVSVDSEDIVKGYLQSASVIINQVERVHPPIGELCQRLSAQFGHVFCVAYVTPIESKAVPAHSDDQDVFLLQVYGSKRWTMYKSLIELPFTEEMVGKKAAIDKKELGDPIHEFTAQAGDVIYIPRGMVHEAETADNEPSVHLTVTVQTSAWTWGELFTKCVKDIARTDGSLRFRKAVPLDFGENVEDPAKAMFEQMMEVLKEKLSVETLQTSFKHEIRMESTSQAVDMRRSAMSKVNVPILPKQAKLMPGMKVEVDAKKLTVVFRREAGGWMQWQITPHSEDFFTALSKASKEIIFDHLPHQDEFEKECLLHLLLRNQILEP